MKKFFLAGLVTFLPIAVTFFVVLFVFDLLTTPFVGIVKDFLISYGFRIADTHEQIFLFISRVITLVLLFFVILLLGALGRRFFLAKIMKWTHLLFAKIPIIKTIYRVMRDITQNILDSKKRQLFTGTALVPFPHDKTYALGLLSGTPPSAVRKLEKTDKRIKEKELRSVFIPTSPHPISGFLLMYAKEEIKQVDIETEDLFKFLISCGTFDPEENRSKK